MKTCTGLCKETKPLSEFHMKRGKPQAQCKDCRSKYMAKYYEDNKEREKIKRKKWYEENKSSISKKGKAQRKAAPGKGNLERRLRKYGITRQQYDAKLEEQDHKCPLCNNPFISTPFIDHCHDTGLFRGLLHNECNTGFGLLKENPKIFENCIAYANKYKKLG